MSVRDLLDGWSLTRPSDELWGTSVLLATSDQLVAGLALAQLDGIAGRIIVCPPDTPSEYLPALVQKGGVDTLVSDPEWMQPAGMDRLRRVFCGAELKSARSETRAEVEPACRSTEWVLLSSGTTGMPKMVAHTLESLLAPVTVNSTVCNKAVWGTLYDIRRYGGMQIFLRALVGGGSLYLRSPGESLSAYLQRLDKHRVTHITGTPSHWKQVLMSREAQQITPSYIRLSGEIVDQGILDALRAVYPSASVSHAFASTEAGVAFEINDGLAGFPTTILNSTPEVEMKISNGSLCIRSNRTASRYLDGVHSMMADRDGFVDTGDVVEQQGDRYFFLGRRNGVINVGGLKVYPEEVEAVISCHAAVRACLVRPHRNPITGSIVSAYIVLAEDPQPETVASNVKTQIIEMCRRRLPHYKVPAIVHFVASLDLTPAGKVLRPRA